jgi:hypothetical protein
MGRGMIFCKLVGEIVSAFAPKNNELALFDVIVYPIETHVDGF